MRPTTNIEALSREFCELAGIELRDHCATCMSASHLCRDCSLRGKLIPDFTNAREVLRVMRGREDYHSFVKLLGCASIDFNDGVGTYFIPDTLMLDITGLLLAEAVECMRGKR